MKIVLALIRWYQKYISLDTGVIKIFFPGGRTCRFSPTCSQYMADAVSRYGIIKGLFLGVKRLSRCHPFSPGGVDPLK